MLGVFTTAEPPLDGPTLQAKVSNKATAGSLVGQVVKTPSGPLQLGKFVGKGTFGGVFEVAKNPSEVIKIATNDPFSPQSFANQAKGSNLLKKAKIPTADILEEIPAEGGQPPMLRMENVFKRPGAFQATSKGLKMTQANIDAPGIPLAEMTPAEATAVANAMQELNNKIAGDGLIFADNHLGNVVMVPKAGGGLTAVVVDSDFVVTKGDLLEQLGGRTGDELVQDVIDKKAIPPIAQVLVGVLFKGGGLEALGPALTSQGLMDALMQARNAITAAENAAPLPRGVPPPQMQAPSGPTIQNP